MRSAPHLLVFDGFADWEAAYAVAELCRSGGQRVTTVGYTGEPVVSMGGLCVLPDYELTELDTEMIRMLILPGGEAWERQPLDSSLEALLRHLLAHRVPIAAICAGTIALARIGALDERRHTSNGLAWLKDKVPGYAAEERYVDTLAVRDGGVITASGLGALEFAREIFAELGVFSPEDCATWYRIFKEGRL
jgi:putative intracellular protease/amidase